MIVPNMSFLEIRTEITNDSDRVVYKINTLKEKAIKKFKKDNKRENFFLEEYIHQTSKNKYVVGWYVRNGIFDKPNSISFCVSDDINGGKRVLTLHDSTILPSGNKVKGISIYWSHFWKRYRERECIDDKISFNKLVTLYLDINCINNQMYPIVLNEDILRYYKQYGEFSGFAFVGVYGICLANREYQGDEISIDNPNNNTIECINFKTYLSYKMLESSQQKALKSTLEEQKKINENNYKQNKVNLIAKNNNLDIISPIK